MSVANKKLEVIVDWHESGRYTLKEGTGGKYKDCVMDGLFGNVDKGDFYRAVAKRLGELAASDIAFEYVDCSYDK